MQGDSHLRQWAEATDRGAAELFSSLVREKQNLAPGQLMELWDDQNLFQLPGSYSDLDLKGRLIHFVLKRWYSLCLVNLVLRGQKIKMPYEVAAPFVVEKKYRGNPVFGENNGESKGGRYLTDVQRCVYNKHGLVDKFALSDGLRATYSNLTRDTIRFSERFGLAYTIAAHLYHRELLMLAAEREIVDRVSSLLGDNVVLLSAHTFTKRPGSPATPYHHGTAYQPVENTLTVFIALTDCKEDNSCLTLIPGSEVFAGKEILENVYGKINWGHLASDLGAAEREQLILQIAFTLRSLDVGMRNFQTHANFSLLSARIKFLLQSEQARGEIATYRGLKMELDPFEAFIFSERNFHGSGPNASNRVRCALALRYAKGDELIDDRRHLKSFRTFAPSRDQGLARIFDEFVGDRVNAVIQVAGDPEAARRAGNNVICQDALMKRISECVP